MVRRRRVRKVSFCRNGNPIVYKATYYKGENYCIFAGMNDKDRARLVKSALSGEAAYKHVELPSLEDIVCAGSINTLRTLPQCTSDMWGHAERKR